MSPVTRTVWVNGIRLHYRRYGAGPPVVLLHGWPQTGYCWRFVAEALATEHTVLVPDLRGYGRSDKPQSGMDKRTMAADVSELVRSLGFDQVAVVGHDRGGRVAHRWALDRPDEVTRVAFLDVAPLRAIFERLDAGLATQFWGWWFHRQPDLPERMVGADVAGYLGFFFENLAFEKLEQQAVDEYVRAFSRPGALRCGFDDYRADAVDSVRNDEDFAAGRRVTVPLFALWGGEGGMADFPVLETWREYADDVRGQAVPGCGHFLPEEAPDEVADQLRAFLAGKLDAGPSD